ncbi:MAG: hypothetical protein AB1489_39310 [Acidobacteriota bacterium]
MLSNDRQEDLATQEPSQGNNGNFPVESVSQQQLMIALQKSLCIIAEVYQLCNTDSAEDPAAILQAIRVRLQTAGVQIKEASQDKTVAVDAKVVVTDIKDSNRSSTPKRGKKDKPIEPLKIRICIGSVCAEF